MTRAYISCSTKSGRLLRKNDADAPVKIRRQGLKRRHQLFVQQTGVSFAQLLTSIFSVIQNLEFPALISNL